MKEGNGSVAPRAVRLNGKRDEFDEETATSRFENLAVDAGDLAGGSKLCSVEVPT